MTSPYSSNSAYEEMMRPLPPPDSNSIEGRTRIADGKKRHKSCTHQYAIRGVCQKCGKEGV